MSKTSKLSAFGDYLAMNTTTWVVFSAFILLLFCTPLSATSAASEASSLKLSKKEELRQAAIDWLLPHLYRHFTDLDWTIEICFDKQNSQRRNLLVRYKKRFSSQVTPINRIVAHIKPSFLDPTASTARNRLSLSKTSEAILTVTDFKDIEAEQEEVVFDNMTRFLIAKIRAYSLAGEDSDDVKAKVAFANIDQIAIALELEWEHPSIDSNAYQETIRFEPESRVTCP